MERDKDQIISLEIDDDKVILFTRNGLAGPYYTDSFLLEIYEKLKNRYEFGQPENEFFGYEDPEGAWVLLNDFLQKTNFLENVSLSDYEEYRSRYDIGLDFKKGETIRQYDIPISIDNQITLKRFAKELDEWRIFNKDEVDSSVFNPNIFRYYSCGKMIDFVFALIHYFVFNGYKIRKCAHCGKLFAVKSLKEKYCSRSSPFDGYGQYTCRKAVKAIKDMLDKKRKSENSRLKKRAEEYGRQSKHYKNWREFADTADDYKEKIKSGASVELLQEYKNFLFDSENVRPKYQRIKNW